MPAHSLWLHRLPDILNTLRHAKELTHLDRQGFEQLFQIKARRARVLMSRFTGIRLGNVWAVDRLKLIKALETIEAGKEFQEHQANKERVAVKLAEAKAEAQRQAPARQVVIPTKPQDKWMTLDSLPSGVKIQSAELRIEFTGTEDLLLKLFQISQALANDFESFSELIERNDDEGFASDGSTKTMAGGSSS